MVQLGLWQAVIKSEYLSTVIIQYIMKKMVQLLQISKKNQKKNIF